jgi:hypothetical protein
MADRYGWSYEKLAGTRDLFVELLTAERSSDQVLLVPPEHETRYRATAQQMVAVPE